VISHEQEYGYFCSENQLGQSNASPGRNCSFVKSCIYEICNMKLNLKLSIIKLLESCMCVCVCTCMWENW